MPESNNIKEVKTENRLHNLDAVRGFASSWVALFHFATWIQESWAYPFMAIGHHGVQVFFIVSGLVIPYSMERAGYQLKSFGGFVAKRLVRLHPPYLVAFAITYALFYLAQKMGSPPSIYVDLSLTGIFTHVFLLNNYLDRYWLSPVYWTLAVELQFYLSIALVFTYAMGSRVVFAFGLAAISLVAAWTFPEVLLLKNIQYFLAGLFIARYSLGKLTKEEGYSVWAALLTHTLIYEGFGTGFFVLLLTPVAILVPFSWPKWLSFLGTISYSLYLLHGPLGQRVISQLVKLNDDFIFRHIAVIAGFGASVLFSYLFYLWIEKPFQKLSKSISYKK